MASPFTEEMQIVRKRVNELPMDTSDDPKLAEEKSVLALNEVLWIALLCLLRWERHYHLARRWNADSVRQKFLEQAKDGWAYADDVAERIIQLGGEPDFDPETLFGRSAGEGGERVPLRSLLREELSAERITSAAYGDIVRWLDDKDPVSCRLVERFLEKEDEHIEDLISLLLGNLGGGESGHAPSAGAGGAT